MATRVETPLYPGESVVRRRDLRPRPAFANDIWLIEYYMQELGPNPQRGTAPVIIALDLFSRSACARMYPLSGRLASSIAAFLSALMGGAFPHALPIGKPRGVIAGDKYIDRLFKNADVTSLGIDIVPFVRHLPYAFPYLKRIRMALSCRRPQSIEEANDRLPGICAELNARWLCVLGGKTPADVWRESIAKTPHHTVQE